MKNKKFWQFKQKADDESTGELLLYGEIADSSWWGDEVTPKQFKADLDTLGDISTLNIYINSPGGDCFAGQAIYSMLKRCKAQKNVYVDGLAASMASVIACAGDKVIMPINAMMMIHNPWTIACGNANDFRNMADTLDKIGGSSVAVYKAKSGLDDAEIKQIMDDETWMSAQDALDMGFCDEIEDAVQVAASISGDILNFNGLKMSLSRFKSFPVGKLKAIKKDDSEEASDNDEKINGHENLGGGEDINENDDNNKKNGVSKPAESIKKQGLPVSLYMKLAKINEKRAKI